MFAEEVIRFSIVDDENTSAKAQGHFDGIRDATAALFFHRDTIDHNLNVVHFISVGFHSFGYFQHLTVDTGTEKTVFQNLFEELAIMAFSSFHHRGENLDLRPTGKFQYRVDNLVDALLLHFRAAINAELNAGSCK